MNCTRQPFANVLHWIELLLWIAGLSALAYCTCTVIEAKVTQARLSHVLELDRHLQRHIETSGQVAGPDLKPSPGKEIGSPSIGNLVGRLSIPKIGLSAMIIEGDDARTLSRGLGHIPGTALPGQSGNIGIAGHRDT